MSFTDRGIFNLYSQVLDQMEMLSAFTDVLHVANLSTGAHLISILKQVRCHTVHYGKPRGTRQKDINFGR